MKMPPFTAPLDQLEQIGDARKLWHWREGDPDYVGRLGLRPEHIPELIEIARGWAERTEWPEDEDDITVFAPIHAWRALGQLHAVEAIQPLLDMLDPLDRKDDDWFLEEFPHVFGLAGPGALEPLAAYLLDEAHGVYTRIAAAHGLKEVVKHHPESRAPAAASLTHCLAGYAGQDESLNAFLVSYLMDLRAIDAAELIERAYAAGRIDEMVCGDWETVRQELGVPGIGLAMPERPAHRSLFGPDTIGNVNLAPSGQGHAARERKRPKKAGAAEPQEEPAEAVSPQAWLVTRGSAVRR